jgi:serine/threonine protein kinase
MDGGALLGQGTFGCVFDPPLKCNEAGKNPRKFPIGKIGKPADADAELDAAEALIAVPHSATYFVLPDPDSRCIPQPVKSQPDKRDMKQCRVIQRHGMKDMVHFVMPYGGITIFNQFEKVKRKEGTFSLRAAVTRLLECGAQLALHGYVHYDISPKNILFDEKTGLPRLIDFGMSFGTKGLTLNTIHERWKVYTPDYEVEPPEITLLTGLKKGMKMNTVIRDILKNKGVIKSASIHTGLSMQTQLRDFIEFLNTSKSMKEEDLLEVFKYYWPTFDAWSIGYVILILLRHYIQIVNVQEDAPLFLLTKEVLRGLLSMSPRKRLDCVEALARFDSANASIATDAGKKWLEERARIRAGGAGSV